VGSSTMSCDMLRTINCPGCKHAFIGLSPSQSRSCLCPNCSVEGWKRPMQMTKIIKCFTAKMTTFCNFSCRTLVSSRLA